MAASISIAVSKYSLKSPRDGLEDYGADKAAALMNNPAKDHAKLGTAQGSCIAKVLAESPRPR